MYLDLKLTLQRPCGLLERPNRVSMINLCQLKISTKFKTINTVNFSWETLGFLFCVEYNFHPIISLI